VGDAEWGTAIPVDGGVHTVEASAPGKQTWRTTVEVAPARASATVTVAPLVAAAAAAPVGGGGAPPAGGAEQRGGAGRGQRVAGAAIAGVGVVGAALGAVFGLRARSLYDDAKPTCDPGEAVCTADGVAKIHDAHTAATWSTIGFVAGGAALVGGAVVYLTAPSSDGHGAAVRASITGRDGGAVAAVGGVW